ncbi:MAG TPA: YciI family protein [Acidobacteriaceae bacterium]|nr:YciI family protein [Acidobacteriaceae bacterium]
MSKQHFFFRLIPPRPTFAQDMNEWERSLMMEHGKYVRGFFAAGTVLAFGPVLDPQGTFGMALLEMQDLAEAEDFARNDPTVLAGLNTFKIAPMRIGGSQSSRTAEPG